MNYWRNTKYEYDASFGHLCGRNCCLCSFSRRRQAKAQEDRFPGLAKGAEVETIGGLLLLSMRLTKKITVLFWMQKVFSLTFDLSRSIMKVITPAPTTETVETTKKTIIEEDSAIESADEK